MQKITPFLWFDDNAEEAANFYTSIFKNSKIENTSYYGETAGKISGKSKGSIMTISFQLSGQNFIAINGGPNFTFTPGISFFVNCETNEEIDYLWKNLSEGSTVLMELGKYPFSEKFGWLQDKYGVSWQLNMASRPQKIVPFLMFFGNQYGKAEEAMNFYVSLFKSSRVTNIEHYSREENDSERKVKRTIFSLSGQEFMALDSHMNHPFTITPAISFLVNCETQEEINDLWEKLSKEGVPEQCGWIKDKYGISWQIVPAILNHMLTDKDTEKSERVMKALFGMQKINIQDLQLA
ncbi:VOC family protein [Candidatus Nitrosocosmicus sp. FF01]|jgi:predicted 3-demethylubiquinone-9 3-methyltransferase (glyoxalase superfamily)|uniref:VOC family protein n=1 Tax=Candidatus Nitrosocosmicus sp. FF01 TaxID=3397670 RepID=UPI0039EA4342